jgi:ATP-dependent protease ClpP protease subunit
MKISLANLAAYGTMTDAQRVKAGVPRVRQLSDKPFTLRLTNAAAEGEPAALDVFGEIGWSWWGDGVETGEFAQQLAAVTADTITVRVNSPGGDVFDGIAITNLLRAHPATINVVVMGLAASAASVITMAGDSISMMPQSEMMIHDASGICMGNPADMADMVTLLNHVSDNIASAYADRAGGTAQEWRDVMRGEQWYTAQEAVDAGLADQVGNAPTAAAATNGWNLSFYAYQGGGRAPAPPTAPAAAVQPAETPLDVGSDEDWARIFTTL